MSSETTSLRPRVIRLLRDVHAQPVENRVGPGTPDVAYVGGWIELKHTERFTSHLEHYTPQQRIWHVQHRQAGGTCWFWWQIGGVHVILDAAVAAYSVDRVDYKGLLVLAAGVVEGFNEKELRQCILQRQRDCWSSAAARADLNQRLLATLRYLSAGT